MGAEWEGGVASRQKGGAWHRGGVAERRESALVTVLLLLSQLLFFVFHFSCEKMPHAQGCMGKEKAPDKPALLFCPLPSAPPPSSPPLSLPCSLPLPVRPSSSRLSLHPSSVRCSSSGAHLPLRPTHPFPARQSPCSPPSPFPPSPLLVFHGWLAGGVVGSALLFSVLLCSGVPCHVLSWRGRGRTGLPSNKTRKQTGRTRQGRGKTGMDRTRAVQSGADMNGVGCGHGREEGGEGDVFSQPLGRSKEVTGGN